MAIITQFGVATYVATRRLRIVDLLCGQPQLLHLLLRLGSTTNAVLASFPCASNFTISNCTGSNNC